MRFDFDEDVDITSIAVANGFQAKDRYGDEYRLNRRVAKARLRFADASEMPLQFADGARGYVRFEVPHKTTRSIELVVDETYAGTKWKDLAISEIEIQGVARPVPVAVHRPVEAVPDPSETPSDEWWTPPPGDRESVEALAHGFAGIDEHDLGTVFTSDLKQIHGAPRLFEKTPPRRVDRHELWSARAAHATRASGPLSLHARADRRRGVAMEHDAEAPQLQL